MQSICSSLWREHTWSFSENADCSLQDETWYGSNGCHARPCFKVQKLVQFAPLKKVFVAERQISKRRIKDLKNIGLTSLIEPLRQKSSYDGKSSQVSSQGIIFASSWLSYWAKYRHLGDFFLFGKFFWRSLFLLGNFWKVWVNFFSSWAADI